MPRRIRPRCPPRSTFVVGLKAREPIAEDGDSFDSMVILASRIRGEGGGREILIPEPLRHVLDRVGWLVTYKPDSCLPAAADFASFGRRSVESKSKRPSASASDTDAPVTFGHRWLDITLGRVCQNCMRSEAKGEYTDKDDCLRDRTQ